jgi:hypothetical protein
MTVEDADEPLCTLSTVQTRAGWQRQRYKFRVAATLPTRLLPSQRLFCAMS